MATPPSTQLLPSQPLAQAPTFAKTALTPDPPGVLRLTAVDEQPEIVNRVAFGGERVVINRSGKQVVAIVSVQDLAVLQRLEDRRDLRDAKAAAAEAKLKGTTPWNKYKAKAGL